MKASSASVAFAAMAATANGRNVDMPAATGVSEFPSDGVSPKPTLAAVGLHELLRREVGPFNPDPANPTDGFSYVVAPDNTCGYIAGRIGAGYTCNSVATCIFALATDGGQGYMGCCLINSSTTTCGYRASCVNLAESKGCTGGCAADASVTRCYDSAAPYCNTITWSEGARDYYCNSIEITTAQLASTTYRGENDDRTFSLLTDLGTDKKLSTATSSISIPGASLTQESSSSASATETGGTGGGGDDKKTPVGAIVGGVVGGVGAIALVGLGLFFFLRKKKAKKAAGTTDPNTVPPPYNAPPMQQQQPGTGPGGYNAVPQNQQTYYDPKHPYPSPGTQYVQPNSAVPGGFFPVQGQSSDPSMHPSSPTVTDPRMSVAATSPSPSYGGYTTPAGQQTPQHTGYQQQQQPGFQPQQQVIHEAPDNNVDSHRGQMHELA